MRGARVQLSRCLFVCCRSEVNWLESIWARADVVFAFVPALSVCVGVFVCECLSARLKEKQGGGLRLSYCCPGIFFLMICEGHLHVTSSTSGQGGYWLFVGAAGDRREHKMLAEVRRSSRDIYTHKCKAHRYMRLKIFLSVSPTSALLNLCSRGSP